MTQHIEVKPGETLRDVLLNLEKWPEEWGTFVFAARAGADRALWFSKTQPEPIGIGAWISSGAVECWLSCLPTDSSKTFAHRQYWLDHSPHAPWSGPVVENQATQCRYYECEVDHPQNPLQGGVAYIANCEDIIQALGLTFDEGCEFKSLWRRGRGRKGFVKAESTPVRDATKAVHYAQRVLAYELRKEKA